MIIIGDVHCTSKYVHQLVEKITTHVARFPDDRDIVFVGDYVYHFTYDRTALLALFDCMVNLWKQGNNVYVLAGNHDWLQDHFVFEESKRVFDIINQHHEYKLYFITEPGRYTIGGKHVLMVPYSIHLAKHFVTYGGADFFAQQGYQHYGQVGIDAYQRYHASQKSTSQSGMLNLMIAGLLHKHRTTHPNDDIILVHHYYTADIIFPGMRSAMNASHCALSSHWLDDQRLTIISGHYHSPFVYKNYCCVGSIWHTHVQELNEYKILTQFDPTTKVLSCAYTHINPNMLIQSDQQVSKAIFDQHLNQVDESTQSNLHSNTTFTLNRIEKKLPDTHLVTLTIQSPTVDYEQTDTMIDQHLFDILKKTQFKRQLAQQGQLLERLRQAHDQSDQSLNTLTGRKDLLKRYLTQKYPETFDEYRVLLEEYGLLK